MRWGEGAIRFVRPIRWLLAIFDGRVVPFEVDGLATDGKTYGHRFLAPRGARVRSFQEYLDVLESRFVIVDPARRREMVRAQATEAAANVKGRPVLDEALVESVADLVEFPTAVCGAFKPEYLELPREVIVTPMQKHQRYFPVVDAIGNLLPYFVTISNMQAKDMELIRQGNERVLRARLNDAEFFFREDRKRPLPDRLPELDHIIFQEKLGSVADKVRRLQHLTPDTAPGELVDLPDERLERVAAERRQQVVRLGVRSDEEGHHEVAEVEPRLLDELAQGPAAPQAPGDARRERRSPGQAYKRVPRCPGPPVT